MTISAQFLNDSYINGLEKEGGIERTTENVRAFLSSRLEERYPGFQVGNVLVKVVADKIYTDYDLIAMVPKKMKFGWAITMQELLATDRPVTDLMEEEIEKNVVEMVGETKDNADGD